MDSLNKEIEETKPSKVVVAVLFNKQKDSILFGKRVEDGKWELIGGKVDEKKDLDLESALIRQVDEQVGPIGIFPEALLREARSDQDDLSYAYFECRLPNFKLPQDHPGIHSRLKWVNVKDLDQLDLTQRDREFVNWFKNYPEKS